MQTIVAGGVSYFQENIMIVVREVEGRQLYIVFTPSTISPPLSDVVQVLLGLGGKMPIIIDQDLT